MEKDGDVCGLVAGVVHKMTGASITRGCTAKRDLWYGSANDITAAALGGGLTVVKVRQCQVKALCGVDSSTLVRINNIAEKRGRNLLIGR
jgi:hypothetical protein